MQGTRDLLAAFSHPEARFASFHIAGTNGKGSTASYLERLVRETGLTTGLYSSPHLIEFRERIRVGGRAVPTADIVRDIERIESLGLHEGRTFFEAATAIGFHRFAEAGVEVGIIEVGLGGRLDCTNVLQPLVSLVTPIAMDHAEILGESLEEIAAEKAGIFKPGVPVVSAPQHPRARAVIEQVARESRAPLETTSDRVRIERIRLHPGGTDVRLRSKDFGRIEVTLRSLGRHQARNAALALAAFGASQELDWKTPGGTKLAMQALTPSSVERALESALWPGRLLPAQSDPRIWWDGAHNPAGAAVVAETWREAFGGTPTTLVLAFSRDKNLGQTLRALRGPWRRIVVTQTRSERAVPTDVLAREVRKRFEVPVEETAGVADAITSARASLPADGRVLIMGSLFVVGEAMEAVREDPTKELP